MALKTGRKAMNNFNSNYFKVGEPLDAVVYDANSPLMACTSLENISSTLVYGTDSHIHLGTISNGKWVANKEGHIIKHDIQETFIKTIKELKAR